MNILVLRGGALGDFIVTLPTLVALRRRWPEARIELIGNATAAALATRRGLLDAVHSQHEARWRALFADERLPRELTNWLARFDVIVNYWPDPDGTLARHFPLHERQQFVSAAAMPMCAPAAAHYAAALRPLGIEPDTHFVRLDELPQLRGAIETGQSSDTLDAATDAAGTRDGAIAIHPGSGSPRKNWPRERWIELIAMLQSPVVLIIGEAERDTWNESQLRRSPLTTALDAGTLRVASSLSLETLTAELVRSRLFLGHDSGVSHLAAACGVPSLLLFGPTDPAMWAPPARHVRVLQKGADLTSVTIADVRAAIGDWLA